MATRTVNGTTYHVKSNRIPRPLHMLADLPHAARAEFDYVTGEDMFTPRMFEYRGAWYDTHEFERAGDDVHALGFNAWQTESAFSAVVVSHFDREGYEYDDSIVVGYLHW